MNSLGFSYILCAQVEQDALRDKMIEGNSLEWFNWKTSMPLTTQVTILYVKFDIYFWWCSKSMDPPINLTMISFNIHSFIFVLVRAKVFCINNFIYFSNLRFSQVGNPQEDLAHLAIQLDMKESKISKILLYFGYLLWPIVKI